MSLFLAAIKFARLFALTIIASGFYYVKEGGCQLTLNIDEKKKIVEVLHDKFARSQVAILTDYKGLDVSAINDLRRRLRETKTEYRVVKNSLLVRASQGTDSVLMENYFTGPSAIALNYEDPVAPAKVLAKFAAENDKFEIKAAAMNGRLLDLSEIKALSDLPSREVLLAQLLSVLNGVPTAFVRALNDIPKRFLNVLQSIKEQKVENAS